MTVPRMTSATYQPSVFAAFVRVFFGGGFTDVCRFGAVAFRRARLRACGRRAAFVGRRPRTFGRGNCVWRRLLVVFGGWTLVGLMLFGCRFRR